MVADVSDEDEDTDRRASQKRSAAWLNDVTARARRVHRPITAEELAVVEAAKLHVLGDAGQVSSMDSFTMLELAVRRLP